MAGLLAEASGAPTDRAGRIGVLPDCSLPGHPEVFAIGDMILELSGVGALLPDAVGHLLTGNTLNAMMALPSAEIVQLVGSEGADHPGEDSLYVWGPALPEDFIVNHELPAS